MSRRRNEFELITRFFAPLAGPEGLGLLDDASCVTPPLGNDLVITKDLVVADVHFRAEDSAEDIAWKALAVNASDLAAKGAQPWLYFLGLGLSGQENETWLSRFSSGLGEAQKAFGCTLAGGDTVKSPQQLVISITALGLVPSAQMLKRSSAKIGDHIYVSGTLGDAALGLELGKNAHDILKQKYLRPQPRVDLGMSLRGIAHASADISDGLIADLGHICRASHVAARLSWEALPLSNAVKQLDRPIQDLRYIAATHGDDYELVFTAPPSVQDRVFTLSKDLGLMITAVGEVTRGNQVRAFDAQGREIAFKDRGYQHR